MLCETWLTAMLREEIHLHIYIWTKLIFEHGCQSLAETIFVKLWLTWLALSWGIMIGGPRVSTSIVFVFGLKSLIGKFAERAMFSEQHCTVFYSEMRIVSHSKCHSKQVSQKQTPQLALHEKINIYLMEAAKKNMLYVKNNLQFTTRKNNACIVNI